MKKIKQIIGTVWIGKTITIRNKTNCNTPEITGQIVDETKNLFTIKTKNGLKKVIKNNSLIETTHENKIMKISGEKLQGKTEERMKKKVNSR